MSSGQTNYEAYCRCVEWRSVRGESLPSWDEQSHVLRAAWESAANEVLGHANFAIWDTARREYLQQNMPRSER
jgi:hypothetical protein